MMICGNSISLLFRTFCSNWRCQPCWRATKCKGRKKNPFIFRPLWGIEHFDIRLCHVLIPIIHPFSTNAFPAAREGVCVWGGSCRLSQLDTSAVHRETNDHSAATPEDDLELPVSWTCTSTVWEGEPGEKLFRLGERTCSCALLTKSSRI